MSTKASVPSYADHLDNMSVAAADAVSVAHSAVSNVSTMFKANFEFLFLSHNSNLTEEAYKDKENAILDCLRGSSSEQVDLWKLRELALSKGGLLTPDLRKRAWLKLTASHEKVLGYHQNHASSSSSSSTTAMVTPSQSDIHTLSRSVAKTVWNVEEHLAASRKDRREQSKKLEQFLALQKQRGRNKHVRFARMTTIASPGGGVVMMHSTTSENNSSSPPATIATSPESDDGGGDGEETKPDEYIYGGDESGTFSPSGNSVLTQETSFSLSSRVVRWRKASKQEQKVLFNVIIAVLRTEAADSAYFEDDRFHFVSGLQDLTALLMINLESPSLTSMVLTRLAESHLRDSMRNDRAVVETAIDHVFMPLLQSVDSGLYEHLQSAGLTLPTFSRQWITCWFAQDVPNVQLASRILDVLIVSHPLMSVYLSVAMLTTNRLRIFRTTHQLSALYATMRSLPMQSLTEPEGDAMMRVEQVIEKAVAYMRRVPPAALLAMAKNRSQSKDAHAKALLPAIAMFQEPPAWLTLAQVPTDYSLLQRAKELRCSNKDADDANDVTETKEQDMIAKVDVDIIIMSDYPLAMAASGLAPSSIRRSLVMLGCMMLLGLVLAFSVSSFAPVSSGLFYPTVTKARSKKKPHFLPSAKRRREFVVPLAVSTKAAAVVSSKVAPAAVETSTTTSALGNYYVENYYALGSYVLDRHEVVKTALRRQWHKFRSVWKNLWHGRRNKKAARV